VRKALISLAVLGAGALLATACGSSSNNSGSGGGSGTTVEVGIIGSLTGAQAPTFAKMVPYVEDYLKMENETNAVPGVKFTWVVDDDQSTPTGELAAAQDLVQNKHVFGIIEADALGFGAYRFLVQEKTPVVSPGFDGPEYTSSAPNLFPEEGSFDPKNHSVTTWGTFFKGIGAKKVAVLTDGDSPSASATAKVIAASIKNAGLQAYTDESATFATTNFSSQALTIKDSGADAVATEFLLNQNAALATALKNDHIPMKAELFSTGYGPDTTSQSALTQTLQDTYFSTVYPPIELHTAATAKFEAALKKYAGVNGDPSFDASNGWFIGDLFATGVKLAGSHPTPASFISGLRKDSDFNPYGLLPKGIDYTDYGTGTATLAPGNCMWVTRLSGTTFYPVSKAGPVCGSNIPNSDQS
jgi:branched-chain amino acid transport system substrate-binding protein